MKKGYGFIVAISQAFVRRRKRKEVEKEKLIV